MTNQFPNFKVHLSTIQALVNFSQEKAKRQRCRHLIIKLAEPKDIQRIWKRVKQVTH